MAVAIFSTDIHVRTPARAGGVCVGFGETQIGQLFDTKTERCDTMLGSTAPKRKTRNFKGLLLKDTSVSHAEHVSPLDESERSFTRLMRPLEEPQDGAAYDNLAGIALGPRAATRLELPDWFSPTLRHPTSSAHAGSDAGPETVAKTANGSGSSAPRSSGHSSATSSQGSNDLSQRFNGLHLPSEEDSAQRLELKNSNLRTLCELGAGNGGTVSKVVHIPTGIVMAKKVRVRYSYRLCSSTPSPKCASRSSVNCRSCTSVSRSTLSAFTGRV